MLNYQRVCPIHVASWMYIKVAGATEWTSQSEAIPTLASYTLPIVLSPYFWGSPAYAEIAASLHHLLVLRLFSFERLLPRPTTHRSNGNLPSGNLT
jgi:hypothetical protein